MHPLNLALLLVLLLPGLTGCVSSEEARTRTTSQPLPSDSGVGNALASHIRALSSDDLRQRETASTGEARLSDYIAGNFSRFDLQPPLTSGHERTYPLRKFFLGGSRLWLIGSDTTRFVEGRDYTVHPRSAVGRVDLRVPPGRPILATARRVLRLDTVRAAPAVFEPGGEDIHLVLSERAQPAFGQSRSSSVAVQAVVSAGEEIVTGRQPGGLYAGARPRTRDSLLIVLVRMDVLENRLVDSNVALAAFLETARQVSLLRGRRTPVPHSIFFAAYSGTEEACQGPHWLARNVPWTRGAVVGVLHMGAKPPCWDRMEPMTVMEPGPGSVDQERARALFESALSWIHSHSSAASSTAF